MKTFLCAFIDRILNDLPILRKYSWCVIAYGIFHYLIVFAHGLLAFIFSDQVPFDSRDALTLFSLFFLGTLALLVGLRARRQP